jgi:hypothetical protein
MSKKKIFIGANLCNNEKKIDDRSCVLIRSILLKIKEPKDHVKAFQGCGIPSFQVLHGLKSTQQQNLKIWKVQVQFKFQFVSNLESRSNQA